MAFTLHGTRPCEFRFYEELNDYLPPGLRKRSFSRAVSGTPSVKDAIEAIGVPHTEIDLILVDGRSVRFDHRVRGGERIAVYPVFERFDITPLHRLRPRPLRNPRFVVDVHLGTLARYLRLLGFDTVYRNDLTDPELARLAARQRRIVLTRDVGLLKRKSVTRGYWLRAPDPERQIEEVTVALQLQRLIRPFSRCLACNGQLTPIDRGDARQRVPARAYRRFRKFVCCGGCGRIYWRGHALSTSAASGGASATAPIALHTDTRRRGHQRCTVTPTSWGHSTSIRNVLSRVMSASFRKGASKSHGTRYRRSRSPTRPGADSQGHGWEV